MQQKATNRLALQEIAVVRLAANRDSDQSCWIDQMQDGAIAILGIFELRLRIGNVDAECGLAQARITSPFS